VLRFLFKIGLVAVIVAGIGFLYLRSNQKEGIKLKPQAVLDLIKQVNYAELGSQLSQSLDSLVTRSTSSPVVLGIEITNDSLKTISNTLQGLPPDQLKVIKEYICQPASPAAN